MKSEARQLTVQVRADDVQLQLLAGVCRTSTRTRASSIAASRAPTAIRSTRRGGARASTRATRSVYGLTYNAFDLIRLSWNGSFRSGTPYTPIVAGDINGDGYANDRAFVFDPAKTADSALAAGMQSLLANGLGLGARLSREPDRPGRGAQQLSGSVDVDGEPHLLVQPDQGADAAARQHLVPDLESARRGRRDAARREQPARMGTDVHSRDRSCSSSAASTRRRSVQVRGESSGSARRRCRSRRFARR